MDIDIAASVGAVTRSVTTTERDGRPARTLVATRSYDTPIDDVWDALTNPERIPRWFLPVSGDLRLGGRYQLEGNAGGEITACEPPTRFAATWEYGGDVTWIAVRLRTEPGTAGTLLELEHVAHGPDELWDEYGPGATGVGWDMALVGLGQHVERGASIEPAEAAAWSASSDGHAFVRGASDDWCRASIAAGTPAVEATAAAERTRAAYTRDGATRALMHAFDVVADPVRRKILELLATGDQSAGAIVSSVRREFAISQPGVSQHLRILREHGFASVRADGTRRVYVLDAAGLEEIDAWLDHFRSAWGQRLDALATELARGRRQRQPDVDAGARAALA